MRTPKKRRVILVTDGDRIAQKAVETAVKRIGGRCISASAGNPTPLSGRKIVELVKQAKYDPVVVMFDDKGSSQKGGGETALEFVAQHPDLEVMGVLAVASNTGRAGGADVDCAVTAEKQVIEGQVDKDGNTVSKDKCVLGDTVDVLNDLKGEKVPFIVGVGDLGKMDGRDDPVQGAEITTKALQRIVEHWEQGKG
ncbi:MAG: stage V sporulation protein AE [Peptococcaceae bacterium]|jgi:stage V sporulation protein AE|nr:stage V sporulation protein AE [Peptococcaceae bacterium]MDH7525304.1 stage V sporulation protein AE [Peptococcaceae bacterium]